jgi:hypothetical protein|tara:strand:- start:248 stop:424 length:177 start_codon:yes stop_codon:yes gene_type:complete
MRLGLVPTVAHGTLRERICAFWDAYHPVPYQSQQQRNWMLLSAPATLLSERSSNVEAA